MSNQYPTSTTNSNRSIPARRKWFIDLKVQKNDRLAVTTTASSDTALTTTTTAVNNSSLSAPVGFTEQKISDFIRPEDDDRLFARRSWDIALQPIKQLPMNMILSWMAGNSFSLMSIMIVVMLFMKPIQVDTLSVRGGSEFVLFI